MIFLLEVIGNVVHSVPFLMFLNLLILFVVKVIDNILGTSKTILVQQNKGVLAAISVVISQIIFYKLIDAVSSSDSDLALYIISFASGFGTYLAVKLNDKFSKEKTYVNVLMSDDKEAMVEFREYLKDNKITNLATLGYTKDWETTIAITAYAETKEQSRLLDRYIADSEVKFKRLVSTK